MCKKFTSYRTISKEQWGTYGGKQSQKVLERINAGSFQRIADALERIAFQLERREPKQDGEAK